METGWKNEGLERAFVYIAMSDSLQQWAFDNDRLHLVKIGYSKNPLKRLAYLNGNGLRGSKPVRPCLNFTDWRMIGQWPLPTRISASNTEKRLKAVFARVFERFNRREIVGDRPAGNGETEIYRLPLRHLPVLPGFFRAHGVDSHIVSQAVTVVESAVEEIGRQWTHRLSFLDPWGDDPSEPTPESPSDDAYRDIIEQMQEDLDNAAQASEDGWPYNDN